MAKREPVLKWQSFSMVCQGDSAKAGPFTIQPANNGYYLFFDHGYCNGAMTFASIDAAKAEAERLARKIIAATKKGRKHGK